MIWREMETKRPIQMHIIRLQDAFFSQTFCFCFSVGVCSLMVRLHSKQRKEQQRSVGKLLCMCIMRKTSLLKAIRRGRHPNAVCSKKVTLQIVHFVHTPKMQRNKTHRNVCFVCVCRRCVQTPLIYAWCISNAYQTNHSGKCARNCIFFNAPYIFFDCVCFFHWLRHTIWIKCLNAAHRDFVHRIKSETINL